jgi:tetratricopeptide (TPR) repeat protein
MKVERFCRMSLKALLIGLALIGQAPQAWAANTSSSEAQVEARRSEAKRWFSRGVEHYRGARYQEAVSAFLEADKLVPSPALSFNIARAYEQLGETSSALRWYRDYLRREPGARNAAEVKARINALAAELSQRGVQQLTVLSEPSGATVSIDGLPIGVTPFTGELPPGKHQVLLGLPGYREASSEVLLGPRLPGELNIALEAEPLRMERPVSADRQQRATETDQPSGPRRFGVAPWLLAGTGVVGLGGALGFELARRADERDARQAENQLAYQEKLEEAERNQTTARVLLGVGGGLLVTGGVMLIFNDRTKTATRMGLGCTPKGCTAQANGSF